MCLIHCCPNDLAMKDWCYTNNILQVHIWQCLVMQVLFHALVTSSMMSQSRSDFLKLIYLCHYFRYSIDQNSKYWKCWWLSCWHIQLLVSLPVKKFVATSKWCPFWKFWNIKHSFNFTSDMKNCPKLCQKNIFHGDDVTHNITQWRQSQPSILLYKWNKNIFHDR